MRTTTIDTDAYGEPFFQVRAKLTTSTQPPAIYNLTVRVNYF